LKKIYILLLITVLLTSMLLFLVPQVTAEVGIAKVYIIQLSGVPGWWVDDPSRVTDGSIDACMLKGNYIESNVPRAHPRKNVDYPPFYEAKPVVVTNWYTYKTIVEYYKGIIVVNTYGEYLPIPTGYNKESWVDKIAEAMLHRRLTWVHTGGYSFYNVWYQQTSQGETWYEAGFSRFMSWINLDDVDLWPPSGHENELATFSLSSAQQIGLSSYFEQGDVVEGHIYDYKYATLGRPLKKDDFSEYLVMPIFGWTDQNSKKYYSAAVIAFAKAGERYASGYGAGAYVHIGFGELLGQEIQYDADFGRGFIGTAAALWVESMSFNPKLDEDESMAFQEKAGLIVQPLISGVYAYPEDGDDYINVRLIFVIHGVTQSLDDIAFYFDNMLFCVWDTPSPWTDVRMRADLDYSREGQGDGPTLINLHDEEQGGLGLLPDAFLWYITPFVSGTIVGNMLWAYGGLKLFAEWLNQGYSYGYSGVSGTFDEWIGFNYEPIWDYEMKDGLCYTQFTSFTTIEIKVPTTRTGWQVIPLSYYVAGVVNWYDIGMENLEVDDTLDIALWFDSAGQDDAGSGGDASNSQSNPTSIALGSYHGYLGGPIDTDDWYSFQVSSTSADKVSVTLSPPPFVDFDLDVYTPSGTKYESHRGPGLQESISVPVQIGLWKIRAHRVSGSGVYSLSVALQTGGGGGCPYLRVWDGERYIDDNNLLPASEASNGADVEDFYVLQQMPVPIVQRKSHSLYSFQIYEFEREHSYVDQVKFVAVDHSPDVNVAATPGGEILTYRTPTAPVMCADNYGNDRLSEIGTMDGDILDPTTYFQGYAGDYLILDFGRVDTENAKLILRDDMKSMIICIEVQVLDASGDWQTVEVLHPRDYWAIEAVNLASYVPEDRDFLVRLLWTSPHRLDYVGLDTSPQDDYALRTAKLVMAIHSEDGWLMRELILNDGIYAELEPGERIWLVFALQCSKSDLTTTFAFYTEGRYSTIQ
jgi:hypothetical protein